MFRVLILYLGFDEFGSNMRTRHNSLFKLTKDHSINPT